MTVDGDVIECQAFRNVVISLSCRVVLGGGGAMKATWTVLAMIVILSSFETIIARATGVSLSNGDDVSAGLRALDRYGGDKRLSSSVNNVGVTFFGTSSSVTSSELIDEDGKFPTDGRLVGKLINPNYNRKTHKFNDRWFRIISNTATSITTNPNDGDLSGVSRAGDSYWITGVFTLEEIADRWWFIDPEGNVFFPRAVSRTDTEGYPTLQKYDVVCIQRAGKGAVLESLNDKTEGSWLLDVVDGAGMTLQQEGDTLYIGALKPFSVTYFYLEQLGTGGEIQWYYSTDTSWKLINGDGNPISDGVHSNATDGISYPYNLDCGNYLGPSPDGTGVLTYNHPRANVIHWWTYKRAWHKGVDPSLVGTVFPSDFAKTEIAGNPVRRYYIRGVVTKKFDTPPIVSQIYDTPGLREVIEMKYASSGKNVFEEWAGAINRRYRQWGFNAAGYYSYRYLQASANMPLDRLPVTKQSFLTGYTMDDRRKENWHVKNVYDGAEYPPGSGSLIWQGKTADMFDPIMPEAVRTLAAESFTNNPWLVVLIPDEADTLFGINSITHNHMGYVVLSQNPYKATGSGLQDRNVVYTDRKLYSKYALRDVLRFRYKAAGDKIAAITVNSSIPAYVYNQNPVGKELAALRNLNKA